MPFSSTSGCSSPCSPRAMERRGSMPRPPCLQSPKSTAGGTFMGRNGGSGCSYPMSPNSRPSNRSTRKTFGAKAVPKKDFEATLDGIESALRAVHQAVKDVDERQQVQKRAYELAMVKDCKDVEAGNWPRPSLRDARRSLKEHVQAKERSVKFTQGLLAKLDSIRDSVEV